MHPQSIKKYKKISVHHQPDLQLDLHSKSTKIKIFKAYVLLIASAVIFAITPRISHAQTFVCIGEDQVPEYTQRKLGAHCKPVNLPGISYGTSGSSAYRSNNQMTERVAKKVKAPPLQNFASGSSSNNSSNNASSNLPNPNPQSNNSASNIAPLPISPLSSIPKNLGGDRRSILQQELTVKQRRFNELQQDYNNGQPARHEKNYQMYTDRVEKLKNEINRTRGDIDALLREMKM